MDEVTDYLTRVVVAPCVEHLRTVYDASVTGEVVVGRRPDLGPESTGRGTRLWEGIGEWEYDGELRWGRVELLDEWFESPVGHPDMDDDLLRHVVATFLGGVEDWFSETPTGWGRQIDLPGPPALAGSDWRAAVDRNRSRREE